jgi:hypothetical protein
VQASKGWMGFSVSTGRDARRDPQEARGSSQDLPILLANSPDKEITLFVQFTDQYPV